MVTVGNLQLLLFSRMVRCCGSRGICSPNPTWYPDANHVLCAAQAGASYMLLNGQLLDIADLDLYRVLDRVRQEVRLTDRLGATGLTAVDVRALADLRSSAAAVSAADARLDLLSGGGQGAILWLNDIEMDRRYRQWPSALRTLLQV